MNRILLTGGSGFLGRHIISALNKRNLNFDTIGRSTSNTINVDIGKDEFNLNNKYNTVIHCAGKAHIVPKNESEASEFMEVNVEGTRHLLKALEISIGALKEIVFISTVSVYGLVEGDLIKEDHVLNSQEPYGKSKIMCELILRDWCRAHNISLLILRIPLLIGKDAPGNLGAMIKGLKKGFYFNIDGGKARKSMVLAEDVAEFITMSFGKNGTYNLTDGYHPSFLELSTVIGEKIGVRPKNMPNFLATILAKTGDFIGRKFPIDSHRIRKITSELTFDDSLARIELGWNPRNVLSEVDSVL